MFVRLLLTAASLTVALAAALVFDCVSSAIELLNGDLIGVCAAVDPLSPEVGMWLAIGLAVFAGLALITIWRAGEVAGRRRLEPATSLAHNLGRLADSRGESPEPISASRVHAIRLTRRLEALETALETGSSPTGELTRQWMSLLRECNDLHNVGELTTDDFKTINTRLLDLFSDSDREADEMAVTE